MAALTSPADFDAYWAQVMAELAALPLAPELEVLPLRSTEFATTYGLKLTSIGPYRIFAYYCVPHGPGPFPVRYHLPGYGSVVHIPPYEERRQAVCVALCHRGQRWSDTPFAASYPGLLTHGLLSPTTYIYRGIVADCCRVIDFLLTRPEVDPERIALVGGDLALFTAALRPAVRAVAVAQPLLFYDLPAVTRETSEYPYEEINDLLRAHPDQAPTVWTTLAYFDPLAFAPRIRAAVLLMHGGPGALFSSERAARLQAALAGPTTLYQRTGYGYTDHQALESWLQERLAARPAGERI